MPVATMQALQTVLKQTWPRLPAHAQLVWEHLAQEYAAAVASASQPQCVTQEPERRRSDEHQNGSVTQEYSSDEGSRSTGIMNADAIKSTRELEQAIVEAAEVLWWAGGEAFREQLRLGSQTRPCALLQSIQKLQEQL